VDISSAFVRYAVETEREHPLGIRFEVARAAKLPFEDAIFDSATAFMSLMDMPETGRILEGEVFRVLRPGHFLQFSITHPCFETPHRKDVRGEDGPTYAVEVGGYFRRLDGKVEEWIFSATPPEMREGLRPFRVPAIRVP
jgi:SAM-dependent methyltransferase